MEQTLVILKPNAVMRGLAGEIIGRFEKRGFRIAALRMLTIDPDTAAGHYAEHQGKPFYDGLISFITSGPSIAMLGATSRRPPWALPRPVESSADIRPRC